MSRTGATSSRRAMWRLPTTRKRSRRTRTSARRTSARRSSAADPNGEVRRAEQEADALVSLPARELERSMEAVHRHEAELAHDRRVAGTRDEHRTEPSQRRLAPVPVAERQKRMDRAARAVLLDRPRVDRRRALR